jgi:3-oxoacyl-[acyl-carrier protein] reductase
MRCSVPADETATRSSRFHDKVVLVTGAGSGIGAAIARRMAAEGAIVATLDINLEAAQSVAATLPSATGYACDVSDSSAVDATIDAVIEEFGRLDVAVNCAGIAGTRDEVRRRSDQMQAYTSELLATGRPPQAPINITAQTSDADWRRMFAVHMDGTFFVTRRALRSMLPARSGSIVNISSICGLMGCIGTPSYSAAKAAVIGFTRSVAKEVANQGVRVNVVAPGFIDTDLSPDRSNAERALTIAQIPAGRLGTVDEVAQSVLFLASDESSYYTGAVLTPNGGTLM